ncbi:hypothetical protein JHK87_041799 [Glycine soja]|nr:hypothetical protein JHK87_041799 [Glycine soja]
MSQYPSHFLSLLPPPAIPRHHLLCPPCHPAAPVPLPLPGAHRRRAPLPQRKIPPPRRRRPRHHPQPPLQQQQHFQLDQGNKNNNKGNYNYFVFRDGGVSGKRSLFNWGDHPSMAADAVENGWSRFAFTGYKSYMPSPLKKSALLGVCAAHGGGSDFGRELEAEISWEVACGSAEFMQKVK